MAIQTNDLLVLQQHSGGELRKASVGALLASVPAPTTLWERADGTISPVTDGDNVEGVTKYIAGNDFRNGNTSDIGVEIDGSKGIVHIKGKNNQVTPIEVFQSGSVMGNAASTIFKVDGSGNVVVGFGDNQISLSTTDSEIKGGANVKIDCGEY